MCRTDGVKSAFDVWPAATNELGYQYSNKNFNKLIKLEIDSKINYCVYQMYKKNETKNCILKEIEMDYLPSSLLLII